jgi:hypothetical protein
MIHFQKGRLFLRGGNEHVSLKDVVRKEREIIAQHLKRFQHWHAAAEFRFLYTVVSHEQWVLQC